MIPVNPASGRDLLLWSLTYFDCEPNKAFFFFTGSQHLHLLFWRRLGGFLWYKLYKTFCKERCSINHESKIIISYSEIIFLGILPPELIFFFLEKAKTNW